MTPPLVSLEAHHTYDPDATVEALRVLLERLGGIGRFVRPGDTVLLKPNLVFGRPAEQAVNTHPEIIRAVAVLLREQGVRTIRLGDSPGRGSLASAVRAAGYESIVRELDLHLTEFTPVTQSDDSRAFRTLELAREALAADVIINLPKMKTHGQMLMTLAVKNMFGAVPGARKLQWHYRAGRDRLLFARAINEIAQAVRPGLSILDAVAGMDRVGPTSGRARPVGFLAASADPWALDAVVMDILGLERSRLNTLAAAERFGPAAWLSAETCGAEPASLRPGDWELPEPVTLQMHGRFIERHFPRISGFLRSRISPRPVPKHTCNRCGYCIEICPAKAMSLTDGKISIDESLCIRCYCCHELCQNDGMGLARGGIIATLLGLSDANR